jgi:toxin CcdB
MAQCDIYRTPVHGGVEFLLDLQDDLLENLATRVVAPLVKPDMVGQAMRTLHPRIWMGNEPYVLLTHLLAAIPAASLGECVGSAKTQRQEIVAAVDLLFTGI